MEVEELVSPFRHQTLDSLQLTLAQKTLKAARFAIAGRVILNRTNTELLAAKSRKKQRAQRIGLQYDGQGARFLSLEDVEKRKQLAENKKREKEDKVEARKQKQDNRFFFQVSKDLMQLGPDLIYGPNLVIPQSLPKNKKRDNSIFRDAFQDLLQISPNIFEETDFGDPDLKLPVQNKGKGVSKKKNTTGLVQGDVELIEERREEVLEVRVSSRGRIIRNTRKM